MLALLRPDAAASRMSAGAPSARIVAPPTNGGMPRGASNGSTTMSCCPTQCIHHERGPALADLENHRRTPRGGGPRSGGRTRSRRCTVGITWSRTTSASRSRIAVTRPRVELHRLGDVRERDRVALAAGVRQQGADDREREGHPDDEAWSPSPTSLRTSSVPPSARTRVTATSTPTPRPDTSLTATAVLNPGRARTRSSMSSLSRHPPPRLDQAFALRLGQDRGRSIPRPSSLTRSSHAVPLAAGRKQDPAFCRLPRREPLRRAARCRDRPRSGSGGGGARRFHRGSSDRARSPRPRCRTGSACRDPAPRSRTRRGNRSNTSPTGVIRAAITSLCIAETSRADAIAHLAEGRIGAVLGEHAEPVLRDHELADLVHQRVEAPQVHPDLPAPGAAASASAAGSSNRTAATSPADGSRAAIDLSRPVSASPGERRAVRRSRPGPAAPAAAGRRSPHPAIRPAGAPARRGRRAWSRRDGSSPAPAASARLASAALLPARASGAPRGPGSADGRHLRGGDRAPRSSPLRSSIAIARPAAADSTALLSASTARNSS